MFSRQRKFIVSICCGLCLSLVYAAISRKVVGKKNIKVYATRPKGGLGIHWNCAYWPKGNLQVCFFARGKFVFPLRGLYL